MNNIPYCFVTMKGFIMSGIPITEADDDGSISFQLKVTNAIGALTNVVKPVEKAKNDAKSLTTDGLIRALQNPNKTTYTTAERRAFLQEAEQRIREAQSFTGGHD